MFSLFIVLLRFSSSLARGPTKCLFLNDEPCMVRPTVINMCRKDVGVLVHSWSPSTCICESSKYLKSIADISVNECDEIIFVIDNLPTKKTNTIATKKTNTVATNITNTASINCHSKNVRD